jgi:putative membrane protein
MLLVANIVIGLIAVIHVYILVLEMFLWDTPKGHKAFGLTPQLAKDTKVLAANQGLYNGFLAAGLFWGVYLGSAGNHIKYFFLLCIFIAGIYGAATSSKRILYIQVIPALIGLVLLYLATN